MGMAIAERPTRTFRDLRDWLRRIDDLGELRVVRGARSEDEIGMATELAGRVNLGCYRGMVHDKNKLGFYISPGKHGRMHRDAWLGRGEKMPIAFVAGGDPLLFLAAATEVQFGLTEYDWAGGVRGEPYRVVKGPVTGLPLPAEAEIVIEGWVDPKERIVEGPFGEWTGYYASDARPEPFMQVEAVYHRNDPIMLGSPPNQPPDEQSFYRAFLRSALLR